MEHNRLHVIRAAVFAFCTVAGSSSQANLVTNGSFELGAFTGGANGNQSLGVGSTTITGWTVTTDSLSWLNGSAFGLAPFAGVMHLDLTDTNDTGVSAGVAQTIATAVGSSYLLTYRLGSSNLYTSENAILASAGSTSSTCTGTAPTSNASWFLCSMSFTATGLTTTISLTGTGGTNFQYLGLDDVSVVQVGGTIPEPSSHALVIIALAGAGAIAARRQRNA